MTVGELVEKLQRYPQEALIVFEDATTSEQADGMAYETFEVSASDDGEEVTLRLV